jgi:hypothetical protein
MLLRAAVWLVILLVVLSVLRLLHIFWCRCFDDGEEELLFREFAEKLVSCAPGSDVERTLPPKAFKLMNQQIRSIRDIRKLVLVSCLVSVAVVSSLFATADLIQGKHALAMAAAFAMFAVGIVLCSISQWITWRQGDIDHGIGTGVRKLKFKVILSPPPFLSLN